MDSFPIDLEKLDRNGVSKQDKLLIREQKALSKKNRTENREIQKSKIRERYLEKRGARLHDIKIGFFAGKNIPDYRNHLSKKKHLWRIFPFYFQEQHLTAWGGLPGKDANRLISFFNELVGYLIKNVKGMESLKYVLTRSSGPTFEESKMTAFLYK